ncbi:killer toxin resistant protein [Spiromyces aspiralis]|uniref:Killer toxin resistant protein n=1 Tax=Spiromyces aspiralis TaxID=68401 RepID=A0ACC1HCT9_9FUNG|nr:killer toxin resistant protein [Spiromyces aspiralis]
MLSGAEALRFTAGTDAQSASVHIQSVIDPLSKTAQKWAPILKALSELAGVAVEVWCRPAKKYTELPLTRFYRYAIGPRAEFEAGRLVMPTIIFDYLPKDPLYTLDLDVPGPWLVMATESVHDLDNIRLDQLAASGKSISAVYELRHILIEGHCLDSTLHSPPRGLEVQLGTSASPNITDTIVMANYGYLQLQANPGVWRFSIRPGLSLDLYRIHSVSQDSFDYESSVGDVGSADLTVGSFRGIVPFILVEKRPGKETESLLALGGGAAGQRTAVREQTAVGTPGLWARVKSLLGLPDSTGGDVGAKRSQLNIFAVASGHLYERLMSIMILSVLKHTESHVRFWLIENFLSPSFKEFVPRMAEHYGFEFEFVTYKWPHWLHAETEKQRTIWGYKILFLDVLFPLDLDRVIFVDADQIVRADLQELNDMDLHGAPYGYVPFCDDRAEIEGYRFWKTGWWKSHLKGKPYHISALYVVDLRQFRRMAAGDLLRGQYQALSSDEGSLANLDQDLPNNMQHGVPIYSLPQEWLWCETWCSDDTLKKAKTIDLCNNPMTKEPKLERARRLLPEWEVYDREIAEFSRRLGSEGSDDTEGAGYQHSITDTDTTRDEL